MGDILTRRRELILAGDSPLPEWDLEWDAHDDGYPTTKGLTRSTGTSGSATLSLTDYNVKVTGKGGYWTQWTYAQPSTTYTKGVAESRMYQGSGGQGGGYFSLSLDGVHGIRVRLQYSTNYKGIYYYTDSNSVANATKIMSISDSTTYTMKIVIDGGLADIYVNGVLKASDIDITTTPLLYGDVNQIGANLSGSSNQSVYLGSYKLKFGRI